jgi:hypothetical protein
VRRAPPRVSGTVPRRTPFCASSSKAHDTRLPASMYPRRHAITDRQRPGLSTVPAAPHRPFGRSGPLDVTAMSTNLALTRFEIGPTPAMIAGAGKTPARRSLEFFTVNIRNKNTRAACARGRRTAWGTPQHTAAPPQFIRGRRPYFDREGRDGFHTPDYRRTAGSSHNAPYRPKSGM